MKFRTLCDLINSKKQDEKRGIFFIGEGKEDKFVSYKDMYSKSLNILYELQKEGIKSGDKIILQLIDEEEYISMLWACILGGIVAVTAPLNYTQEHRTMILRLLEKIDNSYLAIDSKLLSFMNNSVGEDDKESSFKLPLEKIIVEDKIKFSGNKGEIYKSDENYTTLIQFSSGSTGNPKGVVLNNKNIMTNLYSIIKSSNITPDCSTLSWMPLTHGIGLIGFHFTPLAGNLEYQAIMQTKCFIENPLLWLEKITQYHPKLTSSPNFGLKHVLSNIDDKKEYKYDLSSIKLIYNGAEQVSVDVCNIFLSCMEKYGLKSNVMFPVYGMTEASLAISFPVPGEKLIQYNIDRKTLNIGCKAELEETENIKTSYRFIDLGYPVGGCKVKICDDEHRELEDKVVGNILIKGDNVFSTYYNNEPDKSDLFSEDGWFETGDMGLCINSRLIVTGRKKDIIIVNGCNYYPQDLERIATRASGIREELIVASSMYNQTTNRDEILVFIMSDYNLEKFSNIADSIKKSIIKNIGLQVNAVIPIDCIPKTNSGKPKRYELVNKYLDGEFNTIIEKISMYQNTDKEEKNVELTETERIIMNICIDVLESDSIGLNSNFIEFGGDSIKLTKINAKLNEIYHDKVSIANIFAYPTIAKLAKFIDEQSKVAIGCISLKQKYLNISNSCKSENIIVLNNIASELDKVSKYLDIELRNILFGVLYYAVSKVTSVDEVELNIIDNNIVTAHKVDFQNIDNITEVFEKLKENEMGISLEDILNSQVSVKKNEAAFLISYNRKTEDMRLLTEKFDVIINIFTEDDTFKIEYCFNPDKISNELLKDTFNVFDDSINNIIDNFK